MMPKPLLFPLAPTGEDAPLHRRPLISRRSVLAGLFTAPAVVRAESLMPISAKLILPRYHFITIRYRIVYEEPPRGIVIPDMWVTSPIPTEGDGNV